MRIKFIFCFMAIAYFPVCTSAQKEAFALTDTIEISQVRQYYLSALDTVKAKAAEFLIHNMSCHFSADYHWADYKGRKIPFKELSYSDYVRFSKAEDSLMNNVIGIHPVTDIYSDAKIVSGTYLIKNIDQAFSAWKSAPLKTDFSDFCEYLLPYRASVEPLQDWRPSYARNFAGYAKELHNTGLYATSEKILKNTDTWFKVNWTERRKEPLPRLGAMQLLFRKEGPCEDIADLRVLILRSIGVPATVDIVPFWATSFGSHFIAVALNKDSGNIVLDNMRGSTVSRKYKMRAEPGKVLRTTFSSQRDALVNKIPKDQIPSGVLQLPNLKDVTKEYWQVQDVETPLFKINIANKPDYVFACVFNAFDWRPVWWGKQENNVVTFRQMGKGVVYLPMLYLKNKPLAPKIDNPVRGKLIAAGYPVAVGYRHIMVLIPDTLHRQTIYLKEQERYLKYRAGKKYTLYYWNNRWIPVSQQTAQANSKALTFKQTPRNSLYLLVPEYSQGRERPFIIDNNGNRVWF